MTGRPFPGGPRYDAEWADVVDAEVWATTWRMSAAHVRAYRVARFFARVREVRR